MAKKKAAESSIKHHTGSFAACQSDSEKLRALSARLQSIREDERKRIARDLHDVLGQELSALKVNLLLCQKLMESGEGESNWQELRDQISNVDALVDRSIATVQRLSNELRPAILDQLGLQPALLFEAERFQKLTALPCQASIESEFLGLDRETEVAVFRIFQEILTNIARHAQANKIEIRLKETERRLILEVQDDGIGLSLGDRAAPTSLGLLGMIERADLIGGAISFDGTEGKGTLVALSLPKPSNTADRDPSEL